jgi:hypothetical protein
LTAWVTACRTNQPTAEIFCITPTYTTTTNTTNPNDSTIADYRRALVGQLYNDMFNQRLTEISRRADAPFSFAGSDYGSFVRSTDVYQLSAAAKDGGIIPALEAVLVEARRVDQHGFLASELQRARTAILRAYESAYAERDKSESANYVEEYVEQFLTGTPAPGIAWEYREVQRLLPTVTLDEVNALARTWIGKRNRVVTVAAPARTAPRSTEAPSCDFEKAGARPPVAYTGTVSDARFRVPAPGRIVARAVTDLGAASGRSRTGRASCSSPQPSKAGSPCAPSVPAARASSATTTIRRRCWPRRSPNAGDWATSRPSTWGRSSRGSRHARTSSSMA